MHRKFVVHFVCRILFLVSLFMLLPLFWAYTDVDARFEKDAFGFTIVLGTLLSLIVLCSCRVTAKHLKQATIKDALGIVSLSWLVLSFWGALPLLLAKAVPTYTDAVFEIVSGFTTTGASIVTDVEILPRGILFWRSLTHWLGGLGVVALFVALFPLLGVTPMRLYDLEASGLDMQKTMGRVRKTAAALWMLYVFFTIVAVAVLYCQGMPLFDALCHAFGAIATGGFSTKNASIGAYSTGIQWSIIVTMIVGGVNFSLYFNVLRGQILKAVRDEELHLFLCLLEIGSLLCAFFISTQTGFFGNIRPAVFQVVSLMTATGYATTDFTLWPAAAQGILLILMFIGGCVGSTSGGLKVVRMLIAGKKATQLMQQIVYPHAVIPVRLNERPLSGKVVSSVLEFFMLYVVLWAMGALLLVGFESCDIVTALSASISALSNVGPGLGLVGPIQNYAWLSIPGKWTLIFLMLAGRLELYAFLVIFVPATWKK